MHDHWASQILTCSLTGCWCQSRPLKSKLWSVTSYMSCAESLNSHSKPLTSPFFPIVMLGYSISSTRGSLNKSTIFLLTTNVRTAAYIRAVCRVHNSGSNHIYNERERKEKARENLMWNTTERLRVIEHEGVRRNVNRENERRKEVDHRSSSLGL